MKPDVVVIGAGPTGGLAARQLAKQDLEVLIIEEHKEVGRPVHCAGLIGINSLHGHGVIPKASVVARKVQRSVFHAPSGGSVIFDKGEPHVYVLHRDRLDQQIVQEAIAAGAELRLETRAFRCQPEKDVIRVNVSEKRKKEKITTQLVVAAEGITARLTRKQGLPGPKRQYVLPALQYEISNVSLPTDRVHLFFDTRLARDFFTWVIPLTEHTARVGLATAHHQTRWALDKFLNQCSLISGAVIEKRFAGLVYSGGPAHRTVARRFVAIGDAAGQTKATTGGGVGSGGGCAILAARSIKKALRGEKYRQSKLDQYEGIWRRVWGSQLDLMAYLRRFVNTLSNEELDRMFITLQNAKVRQLVEARGDIDRQGAIILAAFRSPTLLSGVFRILVSKLRYLPKILWG